MKEAARNVDEYIGNYTDEIRARLIAMRAAITKAAPGAIESISYSMPAYKVHGRPLAYFAAFKRHIGFYATPSGHTKFSKELSSYKQGKGSVQFPMDRPLPLALISAMVKYKADENLRMKN